MNDSAIIQHMDSMESRLNSRIDDAFNAVSSHKCEAIIKLETRQDELEKRGKWSLAIMGLFIAAVKSYPMLKRLIP